MDYQGKLYGKIGQKHFDTGITTEDFDQIVEALKSLRMSMGAHPDFVMSDHGEFRDMVATADEALSKLN